MVEEEYLTGELERLYTLVLPVRDNAGNKIKASELQEVAEEISRIFGGTTINTSNIGCVEESKPLSKLTKGEKERIKEIKEKAERMTLTDIGLEEKLREEAIEYLKEHEESFKTDEDIAKGKVCTGVVVCESMISLKSSGKEEKRDTFINLAKKYAERFGQESVFASKDELQVSFIRGKERLSIGKGLRGEDLFARMIRG